MTSSSQRNKLFIAAAAIAAAGLSLTGCGTSAGSTDGDASAGEITWKMWASGSAEADAWQAVADAVSAEHPEIRVDLQTSQFNDYFTKLGTEISSNAAPCIVSMQSLRLGSFANGMLPLDDLIKKHELDVDDFTPSIMEGLAQDGAQYAIPYDLGSLILMYNRDAFKAAGVPEPEVGWTIDDFEKAAKALSGGGKYGFVAHPYELWMLPMIKGYNGATAVDDGQLTLTDDSFVAGMDWYAGLVNDLEVAPQLPGAVDWTWAETQFLTGTSAMAVDGPWAVIGVKDQAKFDVGIATIPAGADGLQTYTAGSGFGIAKNCPNPDAAFKAIMTMTGADQLAALAEQGRVFPARESVQQVWYESAGVHNADSVLPASNEAAAPLKLTANWQPTSQLLQQLGVQVLNGEVEAADALAQVQARG